MKILFKYLIIAVIFIALSACKKYDEGGLVRKRIKNLFSKNEDQATKLWRLKLYEVNGIDSTNLFQGSNLNFDDNGHFVQFHISTCRSQSYSARTYIYDYSISLDKDSKLLGIGSELHGNNNDTSQCFLKNSTMVCQRNIFNPEKNKAAEWFINKLTSEEIIISKKLNNSYKIILTY